MRAKKEPENGTILRPKAMPRRKSKPKFEVPPEVAAVQPGAWAYPPVKLALLAAPAAPEAAPLPTPAPPPPGPQGTPDPASIMLALIETMATSVASANRMFLATACLMSAPLDVTRRMLGLDDDSLPGPKSR